MDKCTGFLRYYGTVQQQYPYCSTATIAAGTFIIWSVLLCALVLNLRKRAMFISEMQINKISHMLLECTNNSISYADNQVHLLNVSTPPKTKIAPEKMLVGR